MHYASRRNITLSILVYLLTAFGRCEIASVMGDQEKCRISPSATRDCNTPSFRASARKAVPLSRRELTKEEIRDLLLKEANYDIDSTDRLSKRSEYLSWDDYFVAVAFLSAHRSKDPKAPKGACIVDESNRIIGIGYNGFPRGCSDDLLPWNNVTDAPFLHTPSPYECHAEVNAILNKCSADVVGARIYVDHFPGHECSKIIVQSQIKEVIYLRDEEYDSETSRASRIILHMAGIKTTQYTPSIRSLVITLPLSKSHENDLPDDGKRNIENQKDDDKFRELLLQEANFKPKILSSKRQDVLSWDDYFMAMAFLTSKRSKDPNTQVGACIVNSETRRILACGYNGFPRGCSDDYLPWDRHAESLLHKKYPYVCHAEVNAILNKCSADVKDATLYVALFPCNECAKMIIQSGIKEVVYLQDHYHDTDECRASRIMFTMAGVKMRQHVPSVEGITLNFPSSIAQNKDTTLPKSKR